ncbi:methionyl-tRNA formyltransferase [Microbacterium excoecariae]|uniref:methionyl-tRNA formyltransferase n=1 Tax=Microbacterium excoecariae TaxID=2715210 RepID=UPI001409CEB8|nr:methionyl-tRNA formyltransferase [Microbacterium excoecariae]NHI17104.1 methionyl-tRNA formyltransferase [Microbacterium excoecariae]
MRIVFAGTPGVAVPTLNALSASDHAVVAAVTRPAAPQGRRRVLTPSPVAESAAGLGIDVIEAARLGDDETARIARLEPDLGVIVAYGGLVRAPLLAVPRYGWINLHFSELPRWRGAAPVQHALIAGDDVTGATVFRLVEALDAGDVLATTPYELAGGATAGEVLAALAEVGADLVRDTVDDIAGGRAVATPQAGAPTLAPKLALADGALDFREPAERVFARYRGVTPEPGAHTTHDGARLKVHRLATTSDRGGLAPGELAPHPDGVLVGTATDPLLLERVQPAGKPQMAAADWFRGLRGAARLGA